MARRCWCKDRMMVKNIRKNNLRLVWMLGKELQNNPENWRTHPTSQKDALEGLLNSIGWAGACLYNETTGRLIDGHLRKEIAPDAEIPVLIGEWTEDEEKLILASLDPIAAMAQADKEKLDALLQDVRSDDAAVQRMLAELAEKEGLYLDKKQVQDAEPQIDKAEELRKKWGVEIGQLWQLGEHRLICGDCTDAAVVARVMGGEKAALVVTDPPYGVEYADKNKFLNAIDKGNRIQTDIEGDHGTKEKTQALWKAAFHQMNDVMLPGAVVYCFMPQGGDQMMMMMMMMGAGIEPRHELIWLKNNHVLGRVDYAYKHEPILYAWKTGGHKFYGDFQTSILEFPKPLQSNLHPTTKPVELIERLVSNSSKVGEVIYEPFSGSGTTLIACERLGRKCRAIEISPAYCAVAIQRWVDATGGEPVLVND